ncbi:MAG TPA: aldehyde dehydrogenase [Chitinophagaceae bacterium]|nr:aldehyde dehydrogenase [Chitinophagaceae bacterium]
MADITRLEAMRSYFDSGATRSYAFRKEQLKKLRSSLMKHEKDLYASLHTDLKKSPEESWITEIGLVSAEISTAIKHLRDWMRPEHVSTNLMNLPSRSQIIHEPLGVVLIVAPWNYPVQLLFAPLVGAMAAGNCVVLKPSEFSAATAIVMKKIVEDVFPPEYILYAEGDGATVIPDMMNHFRFNHVFYTGSTTVGKIIYKMAAENLVPVTLELGGKNTCVVEEDANIRVAARRIGVTKFTNAGQMCVAPDYVLVHQSKKDELVKELGKTLRKFFGERPDENDNYCKIINERQFDRLTSYLSSGTVAFGGRTDKNKLFIEPTVLTDVHPGAAILKEEIFGPILPIVTFNDEAEARNIIRQHPDPLAFSLFTSDRAKEKAWMDIPFGGGCINNASWHLTNHHLPFGGRGFSGTGSYHGKFSFETFTHRKAVMKTPTWFDPDIKYPPFQGRLKLFRWILR